MTNPWIAKYIFPGGYIPALSEVLPAIERAELVVTDVEILQLHYAETLKAWRERFLAHRDEVERLYDARFVRMWEFYLACSEMAFRESDMVVFQIQMTKRKGVVPQTRDYIATRGGAAARAWKPASGRRCDSPANSAQRASPASATSSADRRLRSPGSPVGSGDSRNERFPIAPPLDYRRCVRGCVNGLQMRQDVAGSR